MMDSFFLRDAGRKVGTMIEPSTPPSAKRSPPSRPATRTRSGLRDAAHSPTIPAAMATRELPAWAFAKVELSHAGSKPRAVCSATYTTRLQMLKVGRGRRRL